MADEPTWVSNTIAQLSIDGTLSVDWKAVGEAAERWDKGEKDQGACIAKVLDLVRRRVWTEMPKPGEKPQKS